MDRAERPLRAVRGQAPAGARGFDHPAPGRRLHVPRRGRRRLPIPQAVRARLPCYAGLIRRKFCPPGGHDMNASLAAAEPDLALAGATPDQPVSGTDPITALDFIRGLAVL